MKEQRQNTGKYLSFFRYSVAMTTSYSEELTTDNKGYCVGNLTGESQKQQ